MSGAQNHPLARDFDHVLAHTNGIWDPLRGQSVFLTGGTGFVGTWLTESLLWANDRLGLGLRAVLLTRNPDAFRASAPHLAENPALRLLVGDACAFDYPEGEYAFVIHAATQRQVEPAERQPTGAFDQDVTATRRVLEFARTHACRRLLFTSSGAVYGEQPPDVPRLPEEYAGAPFTTDAGTAYGQAKRVSEWFCTMYARQYGFSAVIARLFAFVGPHLPLDAHYAVGNFIRDVLAGGPVRIAGDGTPYRSYLYAADLAIWLWTLLVRGESARPYNVGGDRAVTISELAKIVAEAAVPGTGVEIARPPADGPVRRYVPDVSRAQRELGLRALVPLEDGVRRTYAWHRAAAAAGASTLNVSVPESSVR